MIDAVTLNLVQEALVGTPPHTRYCRGCGRWLAREDFSFRDARGKALRTRCRGCIREASRLHYVRMKRTYLERNRRSNPLQRLAAAEFVYEFLLAHPCDECGEVDPVVLEFNHRDPTSKSANLSDMIANGVSLAALSAETAKCDVCSVPIAISGARPSPKRRTTR